jgi:hypothetical protein
MITAHGPDHSSMSWWPTDSTWQYCAQHTRWTEKVEEWYTKRLTNIREGNATPLNGHQWQTQIRASSSLRRIDKFVTQACERFIDAHVKA